MANTLALTAPAPTLSASMISGAVIRAALTAPRPTLTASALNETVISAALRAPPPTLVAVARNPAIISAALTAPTARLVATLRRGNLASAALVAPAPTLVVVGHPASTMSAALIAPAPYLVATLSAPVTAAYATYVLNTRKLAISSYDGFTFNSYATFNGVVLGANSSGVVVLGTQDKDNATNIDAVARTGAESFGSSLHKRVPRIYTSGTFAGDMLFRTITAEGGTRTYALPYNNATGLVQRRVGVGKGPKSRFFQFEIANVNGADFSINDVLVLPTALRRRVQ